MKIRYDFLIIVGILFLLTACNNQVKIIQEEKSGVETEVEETSITIPAEEMISEENEQETISNEEERYNSPFIFENGVIHAITIKDTSLYQTEDQTQIVQTIKRGTNLDILNSGETMYQVRYNKVEGFVLKDAIDYFIFNQQDAYTLATDVSAFNHPKDFENSEAYELYLLENHFNYAILRMGGRGYGTGGSLYPDTKVGVFIKACEYLGVPYGYYFVEEAKNEKEIREEVEYIKNFYASHEDNVFDVLPFSIDMEYQHGAGRTDYMWEERVALINLLIEELNNAGIECMVYANGARIETYLKDLNCNYWTAMYPVDNKIPEKFYPDYIKEQEELNRLNPGKIEESILNTKVNRGGTDTLNYSKEYFDKVVGWQFTENAASLDGIEGMLDLSLMDNDYFKKYYLLLLQN